MIDSAKNQMSRKEFEKQIIKKAQSDKEFKKALLGNPKETLQTQLAIYRSMGTLQPGSSETYNLNLCGLNFYP